MHFELTDEGASAADVVKARHVTLRPPPRLSLSEWADRHFYLSPESSAEVGRWKTLPYQRGLMDAVTDPAVTRVSVMKSARVGYTKMLDAAIGYYVHQAPCPILVVQPTIDDAKGFSKEELAPMFRDCPALAELVTSDEADESNTMLHKRFPGGVLSLVGANSGAGLRRISRKVVLFDEVDAYPSSAGADGDPVKLGTKRSEYYWDRKIVAGSTPLLAGASRIAELFEQGDQRRYYVPCPQCEHFDFLRFRESPDGGHYLVFDSSRPRETAHFVCSKNGCVIEHSAKRGMVERGEWRASAPFAGHASFHLWAAYSYSPNATWGDIAAEFVESSKAGPDQLKTFINTVLGEVWQERGEAPDWERLYGRREAYAVGSVPDGVKFLTAGVDVQKDRWVYEVVGWNENKESWSIDAGVLPGDTGNEANWSALDTLLNRTYRSSSGAEFPILMLAVDSGYNTQQVYNWGRRHPAGRVIATKGASGARTLVSAPSPVDVSYGGKRIARGYRVWPVGVDVAKAELYGWLRLPLPLDGEKALGGFCHFPEYGHDYFKQLTAEQLVLVTDRKGRKHHEWQPVPGRENHWLDARVYARAAAAVLGLDRMTPRPPPTVPAAPSPAPRVPLPTDSRPAPPRDRAKGNWLSKRR